MLIQMLVVHEALDHCSFRSWVGFGVLHSGCYVLSVSQSSEVGLAQTLLKDISLASSQSYLLGTITQDHISQINSITHQA